MNTPEQPQPSLAALKPRTACESAFHDHLRRQPGHGTCQSGSDGDVDDVIHGFVGFRGLFAKASVGTMFEVHARREKCFLERGNIDTFTRSMARQRPACSVARGAKRSVHLTWTCKEPRSSAHVTGHEHRLSGWGVARGQFIVSSRKRSGRSLSVHAAGAPSSIDHVLFVFGNVVCDVVHRGGVNRRPEVCFKTVEKPLCQDGPVGKGIVGRCTHGAEVGFTVRVVAWSRSELPVRDPPAVRLAPPPAVLFHILTLKVPDVIGAHLVAKTSTPRMNHGHQLTFLNPPGLGCIRCEDLFNPLKFRKVVSASKRSKAGQAARACALGHQRGVAFKPAMRFEVGEVVHKTQSEVCCSIRPFRKDRLKATCVEVHASASRGSSGESAAKPPREPCGVRHVVGHQVQRQHTDAAIDVKSNGARAHPTPLLACVVVGGQYAPNREPVAKMVIGHGPNTADGTGHACSVHQLLWCTLVASDERIRVPRHDRCIRQHPAVFADTDDAGAEGLEVVLPPLHGWSRCNVHFTLLVAAGWEA